MLNHTARPRAASGGLVRILGVGFGLAVIVGSTIGIGILRTPGLVAGRLASPTAILAVWIVGGVYTLVGAACLVELGTMLPEAGGYYVYARRAFGDAVRAGRARRIGGGVADVVVRGIDRRAAVRGDHLRWMAKRAVLLRGGSRSRSQSAAIDRRRRGRGDRRVPAGERRAAVGAPDSGSRALDAAGRRRGRGDRRPARARRDHTAFDRLAAADAQRDPDDWDTHSVRDGARRPAVAARRLGDAGRHARRGDAHDHGRGVRADCDGHVSAARRRRR